VSLIDEALRRARGRAGREIAPPGTTPWLPASFPDRRRARRALWVGILAGGLGAAALAALAVALLRQSSAPPPVSRRAPASKPAAAASFPALPPTLPPVTQAAEVPPPAAPAPTPQAAAVVPPTASDPEARQGAAAPAPRTTEAPAAAGPSRTVLAEAPTAPRDGETFAGEVRLPGGGRITLDGIVYSDTHPVAMLNGQVLPVGGVVEDWTISKITPDRVEIQRGGKTISIRAK
jgi:hypothetical protein